MKGLSQLMRQAQEMQANMQKAQEQLASLEVEGAAGGGMVKVIVTCKYEVRRVSIEDNLLREDKDMLEDLIAAAFNDAYRKVERTVQEKLVFSHRRVGVASGPQAAVLKIVADVYSPLLTQLIQALQCLPGVGTKSAQRMAFHLLDRDREGAKRLANVLQNAMSGIGNCETCRMLTELRICQICASEKRDAGQICVLETPADLLAIEQSGAYRGRYFVLMGHLSPIDGIGPKELGLELLESRFKTERIAEVVVATSVTVEGDATAHLVASLAHKHGLRASRIAYGVPVGGELEFIDSGTLVARAGGPP